MITVSTKLSSGFNPTELMQNLYFLDSILFVILTLQERDTDIDDLETAYREQKELTATACERKDVNY